MFKKKKEDLVYDQALDSQSVEELFNILEIPYLQRDTGEKILTLIVKKLYYSVEALKKNVDKIPE